MTAEIVIMNKTAISLAADSAVTIGHHGKKIYNTVNKLFALSKYHPVGIMIFDSADIMDIPWETVIKEYRKCLKEQKYDTLREYYTDFVKFIEDDKIIFNKVEQERNFDNVVGVYFLGIQQKIDEKVKETIGCNGGITPNEIDRIVSDVIDVYYNNLLSEKFLSNYDDNYSKSIIKKYRKNITAAKKYIFDKRPINRLASGKLDKIAGFLATKESFNLGATGIVIAGFGEKELFPSVINFSAEYVVNNKLKLYDVKHSRITHENAAQIIPFAQFEMPYRFMEGIDPYYSTVIENYFSEMLNDYSGAVVDAFSKLSDRGKKALKAKLQPVVDKILVDTNETLKKYRQKNYVSPVLQAVAVLPKDELAAMAESLVHITSLKRKFSMEQETVAGPIDVAIISKGDGFVWIRRKHYFNQELNPHFSTNYFR